MSIAGTWMKRACFKRRFWDERDNILLAWSELEETPEPLDILEALASANAIHLVEKTEDKEERNCA